MINIQVSSHMQVEKGTKESWTKVLIAMLFPVESRYGLKQASFMKIPNIPSSLVCSQVHTFPQEQQLSSFFLQSVKLNTT